MMHNSINCAIPRPSFHIILSGLQEIIGRTDLLSIFRLTSLNEKLLTQSGNSLTVDETGQLALALNHKYGYRGGNGIAFRAGRSSFKYFLKEYYTDLGFDALEFRLLPQNKRILEGLKRISEIINHDLNIHTQVSETSEAWIWTIIDCPEWIQSNKSNSDRQFIIGFLQDYLAWSSGGKPFSTIETECKSCGKNVCAFSMGKRPLE
jgi:predicted hydrocarbon binding protein